MIHHLGQRQPCEYRRDTMGVDMTQCFPFGDNHVIHTTFFVDQLF